MVREKGNLPSIHFDQTCFMQLKVVLKNLIKERGISISHLSRSAKIPLQTIHGWLHGSQPKNISQLKRVADYFEVSLDYLCFGLEEKSKSTLTEYSDEINAGIFEVVLRRVNNRKNKEV